ncbi:HPF/RaiA family ribosome-associated protein [Falsiroseomonas selenitidurans]|uniref:HPF/RaiA family ribosome-associated protein n=1 Tax=Falsiroseomonas selenitidurans TaxID=2716335 RepID=A0ABX1E0R0_9PROT|nr:HPF/RaiA family ribosome-associated protein [Falsiroseomonas selenitidurans]NKC30734.1 HPF/RaiA family ribosome-associated protein [Falsiroseomonas selenitidurans]
MQVQVNTQDGAGGAELVERVEQAVQDALSRFADQLTRVEVHLTDANAGKGGAQDKRCMVEARPVSHKPVAVTHEAATVPQAIRGALAKASRALDTALASRTDHKGNASLRDAELP